MASPKDASTSSSLNPSPEARPSIHSLGGISSTTSSFHLEDSANCASPPLTASQHSSRNPSPSRSIRRPSVIKLNSDSSNPPAAQPPSPTRLQSTTSSRLTLPSAAAVQRALSAAKGDPAKVGSTFAIDKQLRPTKPTPTANDATSSHRNASPSSSISSRHDSIGSGKVVDGNSPEQLSNHRESANREDVTPGEQNTKLGSVLPVPTNISLKPSRGSSGMTRTLETVEEGDHSVSSVENNTGAKNVVPVTKDARVDSVKVPATGGRGREGSADVAMETTKAKNDEAGKARDLTAQSHELNRKRSFSALIPAKVRANDVSTKLMTVETETVASIPQTTTNGNPAERSGSTRGEGIGTLRVRPSNETIRPKKEKKKVTRKPASIIAGGASTKADIFEAKVASAVDEDTSDSDETFVYESNPPEPRHRQYRQHSRTPSANSMQSLADRRAGYRGHMHDSQRGMRVKRSMKFASASVASSSLDSDVDQQDQGTVRASRHQSSHPSVMQYQHIGLYGRPTGSPFDGDSPFSQASRIRSAPGNGSRQSSRPGSSRMLSTPTQPKTPTTVRPLHSSSYEFDPETADDERAPLIGSLRAQRVRSSRRAGSMQPCHVEYYDDPGRGRLGHFTGCFVLLMSILIIVFGTAGLLFATTRPMSGVEVQQIEHVIASEQELMMDLIVGATNPNVIAVQIVDMDVNIFAKSRYVNADWMEPSTLSGAPPSRRKRRGSSFHISNSTGDNGGVDEGTDPIDEDPQTMLLGRIFHFDSPLTFDGSPVRRQAQNSSGELRLQRPGNKSEAGGSERWERVLQHPFELIVKGILKYELPLNSRTVTASIGATLVVSPAEDVRST